MCEDVSICNEDVVAVPHDSLSSAAAGRFYASSNIVVCDGDAGIVVGRLFGVKNKTILLRNPNKIWHQLLRRRV
jgi:hypothetical protein